MCPDIREQRTVNTVEASTAIRVHHPAKRLVPTLRTTLAQCPMRAPASTKAVRAVVNILFVDRFQEHHDRSLDHVVLKHRLTNRTLAPILLGEPYPLDGWGFIPPASQALLEVLEVCVELRSILLRRYPVDAGSARLARPVRGFLEEVFVNQVRQRREDAVWILGGLRGNPLEFC
jgi:hypothetical protein